MHVIIVGAGLGGLTLALALGRAGIDTTLVEQAPVFGEAGAGVQLSPNATLALFSLGLEDEVRAIGFAPDAAEVRDSASGRLLFKSVLGAEAEGRWGAPYLQIHRADLHGILLAAVRRQGRTTIKQGERAASVKGGALVFESGERIAADAVIGCDGLRSAVRAALWGDRPARFTGESAWRGTVSADRLPSGLVKSAAQVWTGPRRHFVCYPLRARALINFVAVSEDKSRRTESWVERGDKAALRTAFAGWPPAALALIDAADDVWRWALYDRPPLPRWSKGTVSLLGDAAHPMLPFLAQGAAMAVEDAVVLARRLSSGDPIEAALVGYEQDRRPRTAKVQALSRRNGTLFHLPVAVAAGVFGVASVLDGLNPGGPSARLDWLYGYDAARAPI